MGECSWSAQERTDSTLLPPAETCVGSRVGYKESLSLLAETIFRCDSVTKQMHFVAFVRCPYCTVNMCHVAARSGVCFTAPTLYRPPLLVVGSDECIRLTQATPRRYNVGGQHQDRRLQLKSSPQPCIPTLGAWAFRHCPSSRYGRLPTEGGLVTHFGC
jgi:hypothetical protein